MLTLDYLDGAAHPSEYLAALAERAAEYAGFNLVVGNAEELWYYSNIEDQVRQLEPGIYSVSNGLLDSGWPKQRDAEKRLADLLSGPINHDHLEQAVSDRSPATEELLPDTGIGLALERALSSQFIILPEYGTRATTTLSVHSEGRVELVEREFREGGQPGERRALSFHLAGRE